MKLFHRHQWEVVEAVMEKRTFYFPATRGPVNVTDVKECCANCPEVRVRELSGKWTLEELQEQAKKAR